LPPIRAPEIDLPFVFDPNTGHASTYKINKTDTKKINSLEELLKALDKVDPDRKTWLHIEFKDGDLEGINESYRLIQAS